MSRVFRGLLIIAGLVVLMFLNVNFVYAVSGSGSGGGSSSGGPSGNGGGSCPPGSGGVPQRSCGISYEGYEEKVTLSESIYNIDGEYVGEALLIQNKMEFTAGRFIGIDAFEEYNRTYKVSINPSCHLLVVNCKKHVEKTCSLSYVIPILNIPVTVYFDCSYDIVTASDTDCPGGYEAIGCTDKGCDPPSVESCRKEAEAALERLIDDIDLNPSYNANRQDVNDIDKGIDGSHEPNIAVDYYGTLDRGTPEPADRSSREVWQTAMMRYTYNVQKACVNQKTGEVTYIKVIDAHNNYVDRDCPTGYIAVPEIKTTKTAYSNASGLHVGQYFIPLNAADGDVIKYNLLPMITKKEKLSPEICHNLIDNYSERRSDKEHWSDVLVDIYGNRIPSSYSDSQAKNATSRGCYMAYLAAFKVKQDFYEPPGTTPTPTPQKIKGYNYYYRPIDYTLPFPNGISSDSFWNGLYDSNTNKVTVTTASNKQIVTDLDDSFKTITYETNSYYSTKTIQEYNKIDGGGSDSKKIYASFEGMSPSGLSSFVNGSYGITRKKCNSIYALGCGPANDTWAECQKKTEVCRK